MDDGVEEFWEIKLPAYVARLLRGLDTRQKHHMAGHRELLKVHEQGKQQG